MVLFTCKLSRKVVVKLVERLQAHFQLQQLTLFMEPSNVRVSNKVTHLFWC